MSKLNDRRREIQAMDMTSAQEELKTLRRQLFDLRLQKERGEVKNNRQFPQVKADVARLMHHIGELNHAARVAAEGGLEEETETATLPEAVATTTDEDEA
ncbi:MAG TPA: 50S ribosomal protein L29 [Ktedonobacterales bacterium]